MILANVFPVAAKCSIIIINQLKLSTIKTPSYLSLQKFKRILLQRIALTLKMLFNINITILMNYEIEISIKDKSLGLFHINACSLNKNFDDLQY